jgi:tetratricopeptide (TPR) repeat protein
VSPAPNDTRSDATVDRYEAAWRATVQLLRGGRSWSGNERDCVFLNGRGPRFATISALTGLDFPDDGRALARVDWDQDGDLDLWARNRTGPRLRLMLNRAADLGTARHVALRLRGTTANRDAIGARIEIVLGEDDGLRQVQTLSAGEGFLSQSSKWLHFGLGANATIREARVRWPGGDSETFEGIKVGGRYLLVQGSGRAEEQSGAARALSLHPAAQVAPPPTQAGRIVLPGKTLFPIVRYQPLEAPNGPGPVEGPGGPELLEGPPSPGRPLLLSLWASWCPPCLRELEEYAARAAELRAAGVEVLALTVDGLDAAKASDPAKAEGFLRSIRFPFRSGQATPEILDKIERLQDALFDRVPPLGVPTAFLLDPEDRLAVVYRGAAPVAEILEDVAQLDVSPEQRRDLAIPFPGRSLTRPAPPEDYLLAVAGSFERASYPDEVARYVAAAAQALQPHLDASAPAAERERAGDRIAALRLRAAAALEEDGRPKESIEQLRLAAAIRPGDAGIHQQLGRSLAAAKRGNEALWEFLRAIEMAPEDADLQNDLGATLSSMGRPAEGTPAFREALALRPDFFEAALNLARALRAQGLSGEAIGAYRDAARISPAAPAPVLELGWILATSPDPAAREPDEAIRLAERARTLEGASASRTLDLLAAAYAAAGRFAEAIATGESAANAADGAPDPVAAGAIRARVALYRAGKPFVTAGGSSLAP